MCVCVCVCVCAKERNLNKEIALTRSLSDRNSIRLPR